MSITAEREMQSCKVLEYTFLIHNNAEFDISQKRSYNQIFFVNKHGFRKKI